MKAKLTKAQRSEASDVAEQMSIEPEQFAFELVSLRSQLSECQRERDAEKYMTEHVNMPRLRNALANVESLQQQLQQMKDALKKLYEKADHIRHWHDTMYNAETGKTEGMIVSATAVRELWEAKAAARALVSGTRKEEQ